jgi:hypothetical protein
MPSYAFPCPGSVSSVAKPAGESPDFLPPGNPILLDKTPNPQSFQALSLSLNCSPRPSRCNSIVININLYYLKKKKKKKVLLNTYVSDIGLELYYYARVTYLLQNIFSLTVKSDSLLLRICIMNYISYNMPSDLLLLP